MLWQNNGVKMKNTLTKTYKKSLSEEEIKLILSKELKCAPSAINWKFSFNSFGTIPTDVREAYIEWSEEEDL